MPAPNPQQVERAREIINQWYAQAMARGVKPLPAGDFNPLADAFSSVLADEAERATTRERERCAKIICPHCLAGMPVEMWDFPGGTPSPHHRFKGEAKGHDLMRDCRAAAIRAGDAGWPAKSALGFQGYTGYHASFQASRSG